MIQAEPIPFDSRVALAAFRVQSRSRPDVFHAVALLRAEYGQSFWSCECQSFVYRDAKCPHIEAAIAAQFNQSRRTG